MVDRMRPGPTGKFPLGKLNEDDEGELCIQIGIEGSGKAVIIDFGKQLKWIGLDADTAQRIGEKLCMLAERLRQGG